MKFAFMAAERACFPIRFMCRQLQVSASGFYAFHKRAESKQAVRDKVLTVEVTATHLRSRKAYGSPRVHAALQAAGWRVSRKRVARLMRETGVYALRKRRFVRTTDSQHDHPVAPNVLKREFTTTGPNKVWVTDITYVPTREGWVYLAVILDLYSRKVVGWAIGDNMERGLVLRALHMALLHRQPPTHLIHHSDRGSQYASGDYRNALALNGIECSMSRKGNCWDNAVAESFFAGLKKEFVYHVNFKTREEAQAGLFEWIEVFYNRQRLHSTLAYLSPTQYELKHQALPKAA